MKKCFLHNIFIYTYTVNPKCVMGVKICILKFVFKVFTRCSTRGLPFYIENFIVKFKNTKSYPNINSRSLFSSLYGVSLLRVTSTILDNLLEPSNNKFWYKRVRRIQATYINIGLHVFFFKASFSILYRIIEAKTHDPKSVTGIEDVHVNSLSLALCLSRK